MIYIYSYCAVIRLPSGTINRGMAVTNRQKTSNLEVKKQTNNQNMKETIIGDVLTFEEHPEYKSEWVAKWRGYTVATAAVKDNGTVDITEWHPDGESTSYTSASSLEAAWRHIKNYTLTDFDDELKSQISSGVTFKR